MNDFSSLKIAIIADEFTEVSLEGVCKLRNLTPLNYKAILKFWKPDILLAESCWLGKRGSWKYKIANYPEHNRRNNNKLKELVEYAKDLNIPTVFWNREDGVHFNRFIDSAKLFDHIFTTDSNMLKNYKSICKSTKTFDYLTFTYNSKLHFPQNLVKNNKFCFLGSYRADHHENRRKFQDYLFKPALKFGLDIYDRNSDRKSNIYRFPQEYSNHIYPKVSNKKTGEIYNKYIGGLNVNTVTNSPTMFSRRVLEILACKAPLITTDSKSMQNYFRDCAFITNSKEDTESILMDIQENYSSKRIQDKINEGYSIVTNNFTVRKWLEKIVSKTK